MARFTAQDIANYAAVIVAAVALYIGWDQAQIGRNQQHADVYPVVKLRSTFTNTTKDNGTVVRTLTLKAMNAGVGPAFIESTDWQIQNTTIFAASDLQKFFPEGLTALQQYYGPHQNFLLAAKEEAVIWQVEWPIDEDVLPKIQSFLQSFWEMQMSVCYCSLYKRCWISRTDAKTPMPDTVKSCPVEQLDPSNNNS